MHAIIRLETHQAVHLGRIRYQPRLPGRPNLFLTLLPEYSRRKGRAGVRMFACQFLAISVVSLIPASGPFGHFPVVQQIVRFQNSIGGYLVPIRTVQLMLVVPAHLRSCPSG